MQTACSASRCSPEIVADHISPAVEARPGEVFVATADEHFELAGSGGGVYAGPGFYAFDETADRWRLLRSA